MSNTTRRDHAYLLSLTREQLEQLHTADIAVVDTDSERFRFVPTDCESEAIDHLHGTDVEISVHGVTHRD